MSNFRIRYGFAIGPEGTYSTRSDKTLFTENDTTPDVTTGVLFYSQNTTNTVITYFDIQGAGGQPGDGFNQGKEIVVFYKDGSTSVANSVQMVGISTTGTAYPAGTICRYFLHNSAWYETLHITPIQAQFVTPAVTVVAGSFAVDVTTANVLVLAASNASAVLRSFSGGEVGQVVTIISNSTNQLTISGSGNIYVPGTASILASNSGAYQFVKFDTTWRMIKGAAAA